MYVCNCKGGRDITHRKNHTGGYGFKPVPTTTDGVCKLCGHYAVTVTKEYSQAKGIYDTSRFLEDRERIFFEDHSLAIKFDCLSA